MVYQQLQYKATIEHLDRTPRYDHIPLFCYLDICIDDLPSKIEGNFTFHSKPLWHSAKDADIEAYKRTLDDRLKLCSLNSCIISKSIPCVCDVSHVDAISNFHNYIIDACKIAMTSQWVNAYLVC